MSLPLQPHRQVSGRKDRKCQAGAPSARRPRVQSSLTSATSHCQNQKQKGLPSFCGLISPGPLSYRQAEKTQSHGGSLAVPRSVKMSTGLGGSGCTARSSSVT